MGELERARSDLRAAERQVIEAQGALAIAEMHLDDCTTRYIRTLAAAPGARDEENTDG